jgi:crossover junction endodeoxyribonuclease RusA
MHWPDSHSGLPRARLNFVVPGAPVPFARARTYRDARKARVRTVTPVRTRSYEAVVRDRAQLAAHQERWRIVPGDVYELWLAVYRTERKGDWGNFGKAVSDALNGVAWRDDRYVEDAHVRLRVDAAQPRVEITIEAFAPEKGQP